MTEKRASRRIGIVALAEITVLPEKRVIEAYIANVSRGGMAMYMKGPLTANSDVTIRLYFYNEEKVGVGPEVIPGKVVWTKLLRDVHTAGIKLGHLTETEHPKFLSYLESEEKLPIIF